MDFEVPFIVKVFFAVCLIVLIPLFGIGLGAVIYVWARRLSIFVLETTDANAGLIVLSVLAIAALIVALYAFKFAKAYFQGPGMSRRLYRDTLSNAHVTLPSTAALTRDLPDNPLKAKFTEVVGSLCETLALDSIPTPPKGIFNYIEHASYRDQLRATNRRSVAATGPLQTLVADLYDTLSRDLPHTPAEGDTIGYLALTDAINAPEVADVVIGRFFTKELVAFGAFDELRKQLNVNRMAVSKIHLTRREIEQGQRITPRSFEGTPQEMIETFFNSTPLRELFDLQIPFHIPQKVRFEHQFLTGHTGSGKTTLLTAFINADLNRVARGECSIIVMDSQNELIPDLARLKRFAPGGDLDGRLIYLEPDVSHPLALNIFDNNSAREVLSDNDREQLTRSAIELANFYLSSILKTDTTPNMDIVLKYLIPVAMHIPNATVFTLKDLLEPKGYERYKHHFHDLDPEVRLWLEQRLGGKEGHLKVTFDAIKSRLDGFAADSLFRGMFRHPRSKLNLFQELQQPRVVLINTKGGLLKEATEAFGRFFIAKVLQATDERMLIPRASKLPVFFYIDESADYISEEQRVVSLINKARKQRVGLILSQQSEEDIKSPTVLAAVRRAAIQTRALSPGIAQISMAGEEIHLRVPNVDFKRMSRMTQDDWRDILADMRERFSAPKEAPSSPEPEPEPMAMNDIPTDATQL